MILNINISSGNTMGAAKPLKEKQGTPVDTSHLAESDITDQNMPSQSEGAGAAGGAMEQLERLEQSLLSMLKQSLLGVLKQSLMHSPLGKLLGAGSGAEPHAESPAVPNQSVPNQSVPNQNVPNQSAGKEMSAEERRKQEQVVSLTTVSVDGKGKEIGRKTTLVGGETRGGQPNGRPENDNRTAAQISDANPLLKDLTDKKGSKYDALKKKYGDWTAKNPDPKSRANAAYNAACDLNNEAADKKRKQEQVVSLTTVSVDGKGKEIGRKTTLVGGETRGGQPNGRPENDNRTAAQITDANPLLKDLTDKKGAQYDDLKKKCGDWTANNKDPKSRANAAYNAACVLNNDAADKMAEAKRKQEQVVSLTTVSVDKDGKETGRKTTLVGGETRGAPPTGRPEGDNRTADQITDANPMLKDLGEQKGPETEKLKKMFGDWTADNKDPKSRANAAYNVSCVVNKLAAQHEAEAKKAETQVQEVVQVDKDGKETGRILVGGEQRGGKPTKPTGRPDGDHRTAEQIIDANPALKNLGDQKDIQRDKLKKICGDWTADNKDPKSRADAAYNMAKVLNWIDSSKNREGGDRGSVNGNVGDGNLEGITNDGDARHGTEAGNLKDFGDQGYGALKDDHQLDKTNDTHVRLDGSNMDNFQWGCKEAGKIIGFIPIIGGFLKGVGDSKDGVLNGLFGGLKGAGEDALDLVKKGKITPWGFVAGTVENGVKQGIDAATHSGQYADS